MFAYDSVSIKDATVGFYVVDSGNSGTNFRTQRDQISPQPESFADYLEYLPTSAWTIEFRSTSDPAKNFDHAIDANMVSTIRAWMATN